MIGGSRRHPRRLVDAQRQARAVQHRHAAVGVQQIAPLAGAAVDQFALRRIEPRQGERDKVKIVRVGREHLVGARENLAHVAQRLAPSVRRQARVSDISRAGPMPWLLTSPTTTPRQLPSMGM